MHSMRCLAVCIFCIFCLIAISSVLGQTATLESPQSLLEKIRQASPGQPTFDAIQAVVRTIRESDAARRGTILQLFTATMKDKSLDVPKRWPCCYVISFSGAEHGLTDLIDVLLRDETEIMRAVAAEALGVLSGSNAAAREALQQAARKDSSQRVRDTIAKYLGRTAPEPGSDAPPTASGPVGGVEELAPSGPPVPPPGPTRPVAKPLPWPFPGDCKAQSIFNNYQTMPDGYIHCGLDFVHPAGTPVKAVGPGYVAAIRPSPAHTHDFFVVATEKAGSKGWCYTHMDPATYTFRQGDRIEQGQVLGKLVRFSVNGQPGMDHLHLHYVRFAKNGSGDVTVHSVLDPLYFFDWKDTVPPTFQPLRFVADGSARQFEPNGSGMVEVSGKVDILAAISDIAYPGQEALYGVPVVMLSISDGKHTMQKLVLDQRGDVGDEKQTGPLHLSRDDGRAVTGSTSWFPYYQVLRVTKTDGDGKIEPEDASQSWDTTAKDGAGNPLWPNGTYSVNVYAWDIAGNRGVVGARVQVRN